MKEDVTFKMTFEFSADTVSGLALAQKVAEVMKDHGAVRTYENAEEAAEPAKPAAKAPAAKGQAAKAPAAKAPAPVKGGNSKSKPKAEPDPLDLSDVAGDNDDEDNDPGGLGLADDVAEGSDGFATAAEAHAAAIDKLRHMSQTGQYKAEFKQLQQKLKVVRFLDFPLERGYELLKLVNEIEASK